jgi:transposase InsO family protein
LKKRQEIPSDWVEASFRHSLIAPLLDPNLSKAERRAYQAGLLQRAHEHPIRGLVRVSARSLRRWVQHWRQFGQGFRALCPKGRKDFGSCSLPPKVLDEAARLLKENPRRSSEFLVDELKLTFPDQKIARSTLNRHLRRLGVPRGADPEQKTQPYRRFEAPAPNSLWHSDVHHGPPAIFENNQVLPTRIVGWTDDFSRRCCHCQAYSTESLPSLENCLLRALRKCGTPDRVYTDCGSIYSSIQFALICADLGMIKIPSPPYSPWMHGKIERWWGVAEDQFWSEIFLLPPMPIAKLNTLILAWVETEYHRRIHSQTKEAPLLRWECNKPALRWASEEKLRRIFWLWAERKVSSTATVQLFNNFYYVDPKLLRSKVICRYDPFNLAQIEVWERAKPYRKVCDATASPLLTRQCDPKPPADSGKVHYSAAALRRIQRLEDQLQDSQRQQLGLMQYPTEN